MIPDGHCLNVRDGGRGYRRLRRLSKTLNQSLPRTKSMLGMISLTLSPKMNWSKLAEGPSSTGSTTKRQLRLDLRTCSGGPCGLRVIECVDEQISGVPSPESSISMTSTKPGIIPAYVVGVGLSRANGGRGGWPPIPEVWTRRRELMAS